MYKDIAIENCLDQEHTVMKAKLVFCTMDLAARKKVVKKCITYIHCYGIILYYPIVSNIIRYYPLLSLIPLLSIIIQYYL